MARKKSYKPDSARQWRGKSYKAGRRVRGMRDEAAVRADAVSDRVQS